MLTAWQGLVDAARHFNSDLFRYDLVDVTKEVLQYKFLGVYMDLISAFNKSDVYQVGYVSVEHPPQIQLCRPEFRTHAATLVDILADTERVLASDRRFLLGHWIGDAIQFARSEQEISFYSFNAKLQVSIWGNNYTLQIYDYANKFWSGMIQE